jgi:hypothetical protein
MEAIKAIFFTIVPFSFILSTTNKIPQIMLFENLLSKALIAYHFATLSFDSLSGSSFQLSIFRELTTTFSSKISHHRIFTIFLLNISISSANINPSSKSLFDK